MNGVGNIIQGSGNVVGSLDDIDIQSRLPEWMKGSLNLKPKTNIPKQNNIINGQTNSVYGRNNLIQG